MDSETCRLWLRAELSRAKRNCLLRAAARVPGVIILWAVQTTLLTIVLTYFAALALVRLLHFPETDPWNRFYMAMLEWGWPISEWAHALLGGFVALYVLARVRRHRPARVLFTVDDDEPLVVLPQIARDAERTALRRTMPGVSDYVCALLFSLPRLLAATLGELARYNRLRRTDVDECAKVVQTLFGRGEIELKQLQNELGSETVERALPQLWELPLVRFVEHDPQHVRLKSIFEQDLVAFGVA